MKTTLPIQKRGNKGIFYLRKSFEGVGQKWVCLNTTEQRTAETRARRFITTADTKGFEEAKRELEGVATPASISTPATSDKLTYERIEELYVEFCECSANPVGEQSRKSYLSALKRVMEWCGAATVEAIDTDQALKGWRKEHPTQELTSYNSRIRQAKSVFKKPALKFYSKKGFEVRNPFDGMEFQKTKTDCYSPLSEKIRNAVWEGSGLDNTQKLVIRLALGAGLRAGEITAARLSWLCSDGKRHWIEVRKEEDYQPKDKETRQIPITKDYHNDLLKLRGNSSSPYLVPNGSNVAKRLKKTLEKVTFWLQQQGIDDTHPIHVLRKEFGSLVATHHDIFVASKLLGHSSVQVTEAHYASLVRIPTIDPAALMQK